MVPRSASLLGFALILLVACGGDDDGGSNRPPHLCLGYGLVIDFTDDAERDQLKAAIESAEPGLVCEQRYFWSGLFCLSIADPECGFETFGEADAHRAAVESIVDAVGTGGPNTDDVAIDTCLCRAYF